MIFLRNHGERQNRHLIAKQLDRNNRTGMANKASEIAANVKEYNADIIEYWEIFWRICAAYRVKKVIKISKCKNERIIFRPIRKR